MGGFIGPEEVVAHTDLSPVVVDGIRDRLGLSPDRGGGFESRPTAAAQPTGGCQRCTGRRGRPSVSGQLEPLPLGASTVVIARPCHPRAISSGHQR
jgi:hypothetical protein